MGLHIPFMGHKPKVKAETAFSLTALGKTKAEQMSHAEGASFQILDRLDNGPATPSEISSETGMSMEQVKSVLKKLLSTGYVRMMGAE
jgi:predicted Rossmann fold nucleotide-binding protein DprA/Smf involved in DNA uptake